jgi:hypothetical protein
MKPYLLGALLLAHLLYDFHWQGPFIAENKGKRPFLLFVHSLTWSMLLCFVLYLFGVLSWWQLPFLLFMHGITDYWKSHLPHDDAHFYLIYIDQAIHVMTILVVAA